MEGWEMADIRLKVSVDELRRKAAEIEGQIANAERNWNNLCEVVSTSKHYWEGDAADCGRRLFEETKQEVLEVFARLREHPSNLLEMAGIYTDAEAKAAEIIRSLPDDAIL